MKKRLLALLSAIVLMGSVSLAENTEESAETPATAEPMVSLPIDFSPGMPAGGARRSATIGLRISR